MAIEFNFKRGDLEYTISISDEVEEYYEEDEEEVENTLCGICHRSFASPASLKQHQTVMGHNEG